MKEFLTSNFWEKRGKYLATLLLIIGAVIIALNFKVDSLTIFLQKYKTAGVFICLIAYLLLGLTIIPSEPITLLVLAWRGPVPAIILATLGNTLAAIVEYYLGTGIGNLTDFEKKREKLPFHLGRLPINSPAFLIFARMLPGYGSKFVSVACGIYHVTMATYIWTAVVSHLFGAFYVVLGGAALFHLIK